MRPRVPRVAGAVRFSDAAVSCILHAAICTALAPNVLAQAPASREGPILAAAGAAGPVTAGAGISRRRAPDSIMQLPSVRPLAPRRIPPAPEGAPSARSDWWAPVASAVIPGAGQARLGQDRFVGYMAVEGFLWIRYLTDRRAGTDARNAYRGMALRVSRAGFSGPKPQGNFEYYERMEHWIASGVYDADPSGTFTPEVDTTTFNGKMWSIARTTYWSDPRTPPPVGSAPYEAALRFYRENAVPPEFQWSWRNAPLHQDVYRRDVRASNDGFRRAAQDIGAVIANHVLSTVDAYISLRLQLGESGDADASNLAIGATVPFETIDRIVKHAPGVDRSR
jgi:hypothetical protein